MFVAARNAERQGKISDGGTLCLLFSIVLVWLAWTDITAAEDMRLRIAWGGQQSAQWEGRIWIDGGKLRQVQNLGIEFDTPGSILASGDEVSIKPRRPRTYQAFDVIAERPPKPPCPFSSVQIGVATLIAPTFPYPSCCPKRTTRYWATPTIPIPTDC